MSPPSRSASTPPAVSPRALMALKMIAGVVIAGMIALIVWAVWVASRPTVLPPAPVFSRYQSAWSSAMAKAGVEATFPPDPVELTELRPSGRRAFEATFTPAEISALLSTYRFASDIDGQDIVIESAEVSFPADGQIRLEGTLVTGGSRYSAVAVAPVTYSAGRIETKGLSSLRVEGFSVGGSRRRQAGTAIVRYFNDYLESAPGLTVDSAEIVDGEVVVQGFAPASLTNPPAE